MEAADRAGPLWNRSIDLSPLWKIPLANPVVTLTALGAFFRVLVYCQDKQLWLDEMRLMGNLVDVSPFDYDRPLEGDQLAPIGFLFVERLFAIGFGGRTLALRLVPLVAGLSALCLFARLAMTILPRRSALLALALFAFSDDMIYYSAELKPYSVDVAISVALLYATVEWLDRPLSVRTTVGFTLGLALAPWFSFPSAFVVAGCGLALLWRTLVQRRFHDALLWAAIGAGWAASFAASYKVSHALLSRATTMYIFWYFAFLPLWGPDASLRTAWRVVLELFVNPLYLLPPFAPAQWVILPGLCTLAGFMWFWRKRADWAIMLTVPVLLAVVAAALKRYPLHGRLALDLVPIGYLVLLAGCEWLCRGEHPISRWAFRVLACVLLAFPFLAGPYETTAPRSRGFNMHGDLHKNRFVR